MYSYHVAQHCLGCIVLKCDMSTEGFESGLFPVSSRESEAVPLRHWHFPQPANNITILNLKLSLFQETKGRDLCNSCIQWNPNIQPVRREMRLICIPHQFTA